MSYISDIQKISGLSINDVIKISSNYVPLSYKSCPWAYHDNEGRSLQHGTAVLETEELCCAYMAAYGQMHRHKLFRALGEYDKKEFPFEELSEGVEIFDWGCGQGIGAMAAIEKLREHNLLSKLKKVTLEEPSEVA